MTLNEKFIQKVIKLDPISFIGIAKILKVQIIEKVEDDLKPRDFTDVFDDVMKNYDAASRKRKREILKLVEDAHADNS